MRALALVVLLLAVAAPAQDIVSVGAPPVNGAPITPTTVTATTVNAGTGNFTSVDAGTVRANGRLHLKSSVASGFTIDCTFSPEQDSNNVHINCPLRTNGTVTFAATTQLLQTNAQFHTGSAVSIVDAAATAPTVTACSGGTAASMTWAAGSASMRFDVGTACTSESTAVITLPATVTSCWTCSCWNVGVPGTNIKQSACSTTTATMTNYAATFATATDWTDGADIQCMCRGG